MTRKLFLIDASSSIYRAFFAIPALSNAKGVPTNATLGFVTMLQKLLREHRPDYLVVVWDSREAERRKQLYPEYKATRDAMPEDLVAQLPHIRRAVDAYRLCSMEFEGEEADDVIASIVRQAQPAGVEISIVSGDRDLMQLVGPRVVVLDTMRDRCFGPDEVAERFGVSVDRLLDFRSLVGDSSDNIPGVRGIGEKGAAKLIQEYGTLDNVLAHAAQVSAKRTREALLTGADSARLSRELSRLRDDLPLGFDLEASTVSEPDRSALAALFQELELNRLLDSLGSPAGPGPGGPVPDLEIRLVADGKSLDGLVRRLQAVARAGLATVIEPHDPMRGTLVGIAISVSPGEADFLVARELGTEAMAEALGPIFETDGRTWIGHDLKRDRVVLARNGVQLRGELRDLAVAAYVIQPSPQVRRPEVLTRIYLSRDLRAAEDLFGKGAKRRPADAISVQDLGAFFGAQVGMALDLEPELAAQLASTGQLALFQEIEIPLVGVLARMEETGVRIDEEKLAGLSAELDCELGRLERSIHALAGEEFNISSPKQLQQILFEKLALPPIRKTKTGFSTDESVLEELSHDHDLPREILGYRKLFKLKGTYVDALPKLVHPETGRIHCSFNQTVAATGRLSASNPNLQNIPIRTPLGRQIREAFIPSEGHLLLSADYSQIELRILAHMSQDASLLQAFQEDADIHLRTASRVFGIPPEAVSEEQRSRMKGINFGIIYGSSAFGIARQLGISQSEAQDHIRAYFAQYPGVRSFLDDAVRKARDKGFSETLEGRRRYLPDLHSRNRAQRNAAERMATNSVLQGTAADIIKRAMVRIDRALEAPDAPRARMILTVHDELVFELLPDDLEALSALVEEHMQGVMQLSVPLTINMSWGQSWREAH